MPSKIWAITNAGVVTLLVFLVFSILQMFIR
jgi:hypothetical protein